MRWFFVIIELVRKSHVIHGSRLTTLNKRTFTILSSPAENRYGCRSLNASPRTGLM